MSVDPLPRARHNQIRELLSEMRADVDTAFCELYENPAARSRRRRVVGSAVEYLQAAHKCLGQIAWRRGLAAEILGDFDHLKAEYQKTDPAEQAQHKSELRMWDVDLIETLLSAVIASHLNTRAFSPNPNMLDALHRVRLARERLSGPRSIADLHVTNFELESAASSVAWIHSKIHWLLEGCSGISSYDQVIRLDPQMGHSRFREVRNVEFIAPFLSKRSPHKH
jgi:hypothetical protein